MAALMSSDINLAGRRILLVEDEYFIGFEVRNKLLDCWAEVIGPVGNLDEAFAILDRDAWLDAAVLDVNLGGELAFSLADHLVKRDIPFVFTTGYSAEVIPYRLQHVTRCEKPVRSDHIAHLVANMISHGARATHA
jgi:DNA-binding NtrC family response regulator